MSIDLLAPAKINLALHVTGQRDDGYHLLDTLVTFADVGDRLQIEPADNLTLKIEGQEAGDLPANNNNLVLKAAQCLKTWAYRQGAKTDGAAITLEKTLPVSSGIGGGSSDGAAALQGLIQLWGLDVPEEDLASIGLGLGADVPMCLIGKPLRASGVGDVITALDLPEFQMVLVNPGIGISTQEIFANLSSRKNAPMTLLPDNTAHDDWLDWLAEQRNDLQGTATKALPEIEQCINALQGWGALLARMSGSGATCFGLFRDAQSAKNAARSIVSDHPKWWVAPCSTVC